jgi:aspartate carbamoyltransferase regulatory subunit
LDPYGFVQVYLRRVILEETAVMVPVNNLSQHDLNKSFKKTGIKWPAVEQLLLKCGNWFCIGKKLTLGISPNYVDEEYLTASGKAKRRANICDTEVFADRDA